MKLCVMLRLLFFIAAAEAATSVVGVTVQTTNGPITGHAALNRTQVSEYLGIPYAQPPLGDLRFAPPQKYTNNGPLNASSYSTDCPANPSRPVTTFPEEAPQTPRIVAFFADQEGNPQSEDCLTLNIWTKASGKTDKAVLVWFYGGRFNIGNTNTPFYQGQYIADAEDVIVVTLNYRTNVFGFPGHPDVTQNVGLLDQRMAVEWVRDNVAAFGGDPKKITLFGQSAGGAAVGMWSYAWISDPIVAGLISHSGTAQSFVPNSPELSAAAFFNLSTNLGCPGSEDPSGSLTCVRSKNTTQVLAAFAQIPPQPSKVLPAPVFHPTVDNKIVFADYAPLAATGKFAPIPYLAGNTDFEFGYYAINAFAFGLTFNSTQIDLFDLEAFTCPTGAETAARTLHDVPVWRYRYFGDWDNLRLYPTSGAYHGSDIHMVLGTAEDVSGLPNSVEENQLSAYMMKAWASFAKDPKNGLLESLGWPKYEPSRASLVRLGVNGSTGASFAHPSLYDSPCVALQGRKDDSTGAF